MSDCICNQQGDFCPEHPACACSCQRHAHNSAGCVAGSLNCYGCDGYRPAKIRKFDALSDDEINAMPITNLRQFYRELRAHHVEETTALCQRIIDIKARTPR